MFEEQATKQTREHTNREEEARTAGYPAAAVGSDAASGHDAMQVGMMKQVLSPGMKHSEESDLRPQMLGVRGDGLEGFGGRSKENVIDHRLVLIGDGGIFSGHGEDDVEILGGKELSLPFFEPLFSGQRLALGTVAISARVVGGTFMAAGVTSLQMAAEGGGAAELNSIHDASLCD